MAAVVADDAAVLTLSGARGHQGTLVSEKRVSGRKIGTQR